VTQGRVSASISDLSQTNKQTENDIYIYIYICKSVEINCDKIKRNNRPNTRDNLLAFFCVCVCVCVCVCERERERELSCLVKLTVEKVVQLSVNASAN